MSEKKAFYRKVIMLVLPMAMQNLINVAVTSADVIMLGRVGETVLSASSLAGQVQFIMTLIFFGLTSGAAVLTAQYWGKGDTKSIETILGITLRFSMIIGVIFFCGAFFFPTQIMSLFSPEPDVIEHGAIYLRTLAPSYLMVAVTNIYLNIIRSIERVLVSTFVYLISLIINVAINAVLIFGLFGFPKMGIQGAAIGTVIARSVELIIVIAYSRKLKHILDFKPSLILVKDKVLFKDFMKYSLPVTINELMWAGGTSMSALIMGHMGSPAVAANSIAQVTRQFATVVAFGLANATAIVIGKAIGEEKYDMAKLYAKRFVRLTLVAGVCGAVIILIIRPIAMSTMTLSPQAESYLSVMMFVMAYFTICQAYNTTMIVGVYRSGGDTKFGLYLDVATMWGGCILLGAICAFLLDWPVLAVYIVLMSDEIVKIPFTTYHYKKMKWLKNVTR